MQKSLIITIGRQFGSGGHEIGEKLAKKLGIKFYDKELIKLIAKQSGLCEKVLESYDEKPTNSLLYSIVMDIYPSVMYTGPTIDQQIYQANYDTIRRLADGEPCVIVGRCADYVLKDYPNVVSVFVHADRKFCLDRSMERHSMTEKEMQKYIEKTDQYRGDFYRYHTGHEWVDARNYDLCLNSGKLGFEKCVEEIKAYIKVRFGETL